MRHEIAAKLKNLTHDGKPVVREVFTREDVYDGPYVGEAADLLVLSHYGYDLKGSVKSGDVFRDSDLQGMHTWDDAFFWSKDEAPSDLDITQLAGIIEKATL